MNRKSVFAIALVVLGLGIGAGYFALPREQAPQMASPARVLFEQPFKNSNDQVIDLNQYRDHVLVVNFWATWCAPCIQEMPELSAMQNELTGRGVQFIGLAIDGKENVHQFEQRMSVDYPLLVLGAAGIELARQFGNEAGALPFTVVLDRNGRVVDQTIGIVSMDHLRKVIDQARAQ